MRFAVVAVMLLSTVACAPKAAAPAKADGKAAPAKGDRVKSVDELWNEARAMKDPKDRIRLLEQLLAMLEDPEARQVVNSELVTLYAEVGNVEKMEAAAATITIEDGWQGAQVRNAMAYAWAEKGVRLDKAKSFILEALNVLDRMEAGENLPPSVDPESPDFKELIEENRGYFLDTLGWIDLKAGRPKEAVAVMEEAARRVDHSTIRYHLGEAYMALGDVPNATKAHALAIAMDSDDSDKAKAALDKLVAEGKIAKDAAAKLVADAKVEETAKKAKREADDKAKAERAAAEAAKHAAEMKEMAEKEALSYRRESAAPEFDIADFAGKTMDNDTLRKRVTVIDFWATWCGPCKVELPIYQGLFEKYKDKGVDFLAVSVDDSKDEAEDYIADEKFSFPVAHDEDARLQRAFRVNAIPTIYVIGPCGRINWVHQGFNRQIDAILTAQIEQLLLETNQSCDAPAPEK